MRLLRLRSRRSEQSMPIGANPAQIREDLQISGDFLGGDTDLTHASGMADAGHHRCVFVLLTFLACAIPVDPISPLRLPTMTIPDELRRAVAERFLLDQRVHGDIHPHMNTRGVQEDNMRQHASVRGAVCAAFEAYPEVFLHEATVFVNEVQEMMAEEVRVSPESVRRILAANGTTRKVIEINFRQRMRPSGPHGWPPSGSSRWSATCTWTRRTAAAGRSNAGGRGRCVVPSPKDTLTLPKAH